MRMRHVVRVLAVGAAVVTAVAATASSGHAGRGSFRPPLQADVQPVLAGDEAIGGYYVFQDFDVTEGSFTMKVPNFDCSVGDGNYALGLWTDDGTYNLDTPQAAAFVDVVCGGGVGTYASNAYTVTNGGVSNISPVLPGDTIVFSIARNAAGTTAVVHDVTSKEFRSNVADYRSAPAPYMFMGGFRRSGAVPRFSAVVPSNVSVNGQYIGDVFSHQFATRTDLMSPTTAHRLVTTGKASFGKNIFKLTWLQAT
ncbi:MAG: hypothetical protein ACJ735_10285 [Actinomycetes bacterium]